MHFLSKGEIIIFSNHKLPQRNAFQTMQWSRRVMREMLMINFEMHFKSNSDKLHEQAFSKNIFLEQICCILGMLVHVTSHYSTWFDHKGDRSVCILISWRELNRTCQRGQWKSILALLLVPCTFRRYTLGGMGRFLGWK